MNSYLQKLFEICCPSTWELLPTRAWLASLSKCVHRLHAVSCGSSIFNSQIPGPPSEKWYRVPCSTREVGRTLGTTWHSSSSPFWVIRPAQRAHYCTSYFVATLANRLTQLVLVVRPLIVVICTSGLLSLSLMLPFLALPSLSGDILVMVQAYRCISYRDPNP